MEVFIIIVLYSKSVVITFANLCKVLSIEFTSVANLDNYIG